MNVPPKGTWTITASNGDPRGAIDESYSTVWSCEPAASSWLLIDLGQTATLGGIEIYWGHLFADVYRIESSIDGASWAHLCATQFGEGGQNVFAFPPLEARYLRWTGANKVADKGLEIVEINLYSPEDAAKVQEPGRIAALGHSPVTIPVGESLTVDFGCVRSPLGVLVKWGEAYGKHFSVHLSDEGTSFREVGRIDTGNGDYDNFYWRITTSRYLRFTVHAASSPEGAVIEEMKLRILDKDRMPIGLLERAAAESKPDLYPQSLLQRQTYWTVVGEWDHPEEALFDEFANLEPRIRSGQISPFLRLDGQLRGVPAAEGIQHSLAEGALPIPSAEWSMGGLRVVSTALVEAGTAQVEHRIANVSATAVQGSLVLALRPVQINPYWQHGGHAIIDEISVDGRRLSVNGDPFAAVSLKPDVVSVTEFSSGDVVGLIEKAPCPTESHVRSNSGLASAAWEFFFTLQPGESKSIVVAAALRDGIEPVAETDFPALRQRVTHRWREKIGPRRITVGDRDVSDSVEAQTGLILVNATRHAFKPGPRNYDRVWIRDGSSQALALLYAGLIEEAKTYVAWYAERIYQNGMVPPILNPDGSVNRGYGSDIEFDAQGEFVTIAADIYRMTRDKAFLESIYEPVVRATRFVDELVAQTNAVHAPETRFHGLLAPSISHEGYNKPTYSYWDDFFALSAWRNCAYLADEMGDRATAAMAEARGKDFAVTLARSMRMTSEARGLGFVPASADREDVDPTSTSIVFDVCRTVDVLPAECIHPTYDMYREHLDVLRKPGFDGGFTPYEIRNLNAFVALGRTEDACGLLADALTWRRPAGWKHWAEVVWGNYRVAEYIGDMPHTWIGAEFATAIRRMLVRENGDTLELFRTVPDGWWNGDGIALRDLPTGFGLLNLSARRDARRISIELSLTGPRPNLVVIRHPGAKRAEADGQDSLIEGDLIRTPHFNHMVIEY